MNNFQRSLDSFIEGRNNPNHPANQVDFIDMYSPVVDECEWITDAILEDEEGKLNSMFEQVIEPYFTGKYFSQKDRYALLQLHAKEMANKIQQLWEKHLTSEAKK